MHMSDALLSPAVGATFWAGSLGAIAYVSRRLKETIDEKAIPLMGVLGAFIFAAQMINFTIPGTGSSGHIGGGMILAILLGPYAAFLAIASVLTTQALFFADGGILSLGCNIWNLGIYPCFIAYPLIYRNIAGSNHSRNRIMAASVISVVFALQLGALSVVVQTILSGGSELPFGSFLYLMLPIHLAIGLAEGFITAGVVSYVQTARPEMLESSSASKPLAAGVSIRRTAVSFLIITAVTGGLFSWFASSMPDGLEWSVAKLYGKSELPGRGIGIVSALKEFQDKTAVLPAYNYKAADKPLSGESDVRNNVWSKMDSGKSVSGILGSLIVLVIVLLVGVGLKTVNRNKPR